MANEKVIIKFKDGSQTIVDDPSQLQKYADRKDLDSVSFFGGEQEKLEQAKVMPLMPSVPHIAPPAALINASLTIDTDPKPETKTVAEQPKIDPNVPKPVPVSDTSTTITLTVGAISGAVSPAIANFLKNFLKTKLKGKKADSEEDNDEPTDCKTHQLKSNVKLSKMAARIAALESKQNESKLFNGDGNPIENLEERIEKLEKLIKQRGTKK